MTMPITTEYEFPTALVAANIYLDPASLSDVPDRGPDVAPLVASIAEYLQTTLYDEGGMSGNFTVTRVRVRNDRIVARVEFEVQDYYLDITAQSMRDQGVEEINMLTVCVTEIAASAPALAEGERIAVISASRAR